jgi:DNA-binding SARP family transcriptional activator
MPEWASAAVQIVIMNTSSKPVQVYLLGKFEVCRQGRVLRAKDWSRRKAAALFQRLSYERRLLKDQAVESLWPESRPDSGQNNLYRILYVLRKTLDQVLGEGAAGEFISFEDGVLILKDSVWVDVHEFERMCQVIPAEPAGQRFERFAQALTLYQGDFLPDELYTDWTVLPRNALARLYREVSLSLARRRLEQHDYPAAAGLLTILLAKDPADEQAHQELMRLYARAGRRQEALRQYQVYRDALQDELGIDADPETYTLYQQILTGEYPALQETPEPDSRLKKGNVDPQPLTSLSLVTAGQARGANFIGREREISWLEERLKRAVQGEGGVVFISGEAGQGKTSLMAEFAHRSLANYPGLVIAAGACQALIGMADPYLPFRDLIAMLNGDWQRPWLGGDISKVQSERLQAIAPQTAQAIDALAPDLVDVLVQATELHPRRETRSKSLNQRQVMDQLGQLLRALAIQQPLILLLDDLQWIDSASANLLFFLGRQLANSSILILGAYRPSEVSRKRRRRTSVRSSRTGIGTLPG